MSLETGFVDEKNRTPSVYVKQSGETHLFDCGRAEFSKSFANHLSALYVSHTHMDHFCDFDGIVALKLNSQNRSFHVFGYDGIADAVRSKIRSYNWNLADPGALVIFVSEIKPNNSVVKYRISVPDDIDGDIDICNNSEWPEVINEGLDYRVKCIKLNHKIPSLGFSFEEKDGYRIDKDALDKSGLPPGQWLRDLEEQADQQKQPGVRIKGELYSFEQLKHLLSSKKGKKAVYLTDFLLEMSPGAIEFARNADQLYCGTNYLEDGREHARKNHHLTVLDACHIAKASNAKELILFHFSPRYHNPDAYIQEAKQYFERVR